MLALLVSGVGISMALPTVPTAVLSSVQLAEMGKASGIQTMMQRFGAVFCRIAIATSVFGAHGHLGSSASVTSGFRPALAVAAGLSLLGALSALAITARQRGPVGPAGTGRGADRGLRPDRGLTARSASSSLPLIIRWRGGRRYGRHDDPW